jgi:DNA-binding transcriptional MocR family regulator
MVAPSPVVRHLVLAKQTCDLHTNTLGQHLVERFITGGHLEPHLARLRTAYRARRDVMALALTAAGDMLRWSVPDGGFYFWCSLPPGVEPSRLLTHAADAGVAFLPGASCFAAEPVGSHVRLSFSFPSEALIAQGVERFVEAVRCTAHGSPPPSPGAAGTPPLV